jgi:uncharacterized protein (DUF302 family)
MNRTTHVKEITMKKLFLALLFVLFVATPTIAADGMLHVPSSYSVEVTADRLESILNEKGMTVFNRVKHSEAASQVGVELRETELIIFGNPKVGSPLMKCQQSVAIDLPQKALIWKDDEAKVWLSYNDPGYLKQRHHISGCEKVLSKIEKALSGIAKAAGER